MNRPVITDPEYIVARAGERMLVRFTPGRHITDRTSDGVVDEAVMKQLVADGRVLEEPQTGPAQFYVTKHWL